MWEACALGLVAIAVAGAVGRMQAVWKCHGQDVCVHAWKQCLTSASMQE